MSPLAVLAVLLEVMDKEPSLPEVWSAAIFLAAAGAIAGFLRPRWLFAVLPLTIAVSWVHLSELRDPFVGTAIRAEVGAAYVSQSYAAIALALLTPLAALVLRRVAARASRPAG
jgi:hypothetical protein